MATMLDLRSYNCTFVAGLDPKVSLSSCGQRGHGVVNCPSNVIIARHLYVEVGLSTRARCGGR